MDSMDNALIVMDDVLGFAITQDQTNIMMVPFGDDCVLHLSGRDANEPAAEQLVVSYAVTLDINSNFATFHVIT